jgi:hypothetical protein
MGASAAQARSCTQQIDRFEAAIRQSSIGLDDAPTAPETVGAKLGHQPTPASVEAAATNAQSRLASLVAEAKVLDARGEHVACVQALTEAKMLDPQ